jgi:hypothetical protein
VTGPRKVPDFDSTQTCLTKTMSHSKTLKFASLVAAGLFVAILGMGAAAKTDDERPASIPAERWVKLSGHAGLALAADAATTGGAVGVQLYVKLEKGGWKQARLESPAGAMMAK